MAESREETKFGYHASNRFSYRFTALSKAIPELERNTGCPHPRKSSVSVRGAV
ncbi:uncharacterized protein HHUB_2398 [Halobacterium hubeiense]|uniref:Uncharacterized protein n=1 Tax=Halobacterium hubeiense TaxID=1407499 RepID=A0A0U5AEI4_9EURY|nr:uncharacterized protein HHUB_2398 [Halobacterium hubeiense]